MLRAHLCGRLDAKRPLLPGDGDASAEGQVARESRLSVHYSMLTTSALQNV
jgi:hypothetical protein